jgi:hypothetical protein
VEWGASQQKHETQHFRFVSGDHQERRRQVLQQRAANNNGGEHEVRHAPAPAMPATADTCCHILMLPEPAAAAVLPGTTRTSCSPPRARNATKNVTTKTCASRCFAFARADGARGRYELTRQERPSSLRTSVIHVYLSILPFFPGLLLPATAVLQASNCIVLG